MRGSTRCLRKCRARGSALKYIRLGGFDGISPLHRFRPSQSAIDVDAGASGASSGRARVNGLIGLLMRPRKAKGHRACRITLGLAYCSFSTFHASFPLLILSSSIFHSQKTRCSGTLHHQVIGSFTPDRVMLTRQARTAFFTSLHKSALYHQTHLCHILATRETK